MFPDLTRDDVFRIETKRLWLAWPRAVDATAIERFASRREVAEMTASIPHPYPRGEADNFVLRARMANAAGEALSLAIALQRGAREVIGSISLWKGESGLTLGYMLAPEHWGRGYASEAAAALLDLAFQVTPAREIVATCRVGNAASRRVLERRGFAYLRTAPHHGVARSAPYDCDEFRLTRFDWARARTRPMEMQAGGVEQIA